MSTGKLSLADVLVVCLLLATLHITFDQDVGAGVAKIKRSVHPSNPKNVEAFSKVTLPLALDYVNSDLVPELQKLARQIPARDFRTHSH